MDQEVLREELANISHEIWASWMTYLFSLCEDDDLGIVIPHEFARRWKRQIKTPYSHLTELEKDSDREQADKILATWKKVRNVPNYLDTERAEKLRDVVEAEILKVIAKQSEEIMDKVKKDPGNDEKMAAEFQGMFDEREMRLINNCQQYVGNDPAGLPGHNLMRIVSKLVFMLEEAYRTGQ